MYGIKLFVISIHATTPDAIATGLSVFGSAVCSYTPYRQIRNIEFYKIFGSNLQADKICVVMTRHVYKRRDNLCIFVIQICTYITGDSIKKRFKNDLCFLLVSLE